MSSLDKLRAMTADLHAIEAPPLKAALKRHAFAPSGRSEKQQRCGLCGKGRHHELHYAQTHEVQPLSAEARAKVSDSIPVVFMLTLQLSDRTTIELPYTSTGGIEGLDDQAIERFGRQLVQRMKTVRNAVSGRVDKQK